MSTLYHTVVPSPVGPLQLVSDGHALVGLYMNEHRHAPAGQDAWIADEDAAPFAQARQQLAEYFAGMRQIFDLPLAPQGTAFQKQVWDALRAIPYGATVSYGELARTLGKPGASRAVGLANGRNPLSILVPCHRVWGANGKLIGYGGGLERKQFLCALEAGNGKGKTVCLRSS